MLIILTLVEDTIKTYELKETIITSSAIKDASVSYSQVNESEISKFYSFMDVPALLSRTPNLFFYSDAGNGLNYNYIKIRGFSDKYISVLINDIPTNDIESGDIYWIDYPDILSSSNYIQIQRGIGYAPYGISAIGGVINVVGFKFSQESKISIFSGYGSYNTFRFTSEYSSNNVYARFSKMKTDGYREKSWSDLYSYYIALRRISENSITTFVFHGGNEYTHLAYEGIDTVKLRENRRYNPLEFDDETDLFFRPHYELHQENIFGNLYVKNILYAITGDGRFRQKRKGRWSEYFYELWNDTIAQKTKFNLIRERWVKEVDYGYIPRILYALGKYEFSIGANFIYHKSEHYGLILWADSLPNCCREPNRKYYYYNLDKIVINPFIQIKLSPIEKLNILLTYLHAYNQSHFYNYYPRNVEYKVSYTFPSPRLGITYILNQNVSLFINSSMNSREPGTREIYDAQYPYWNDPKYDFEICQGNMCSNPRKKPENAKSIEMGSRYTKGDFKFAISTYYTNFKDALVFGGKLIDGIPILTNAGLVEYKGVELELDFLVHKTFRIYSSFAYNNNKYIEFRGEDWNGPFDYSGNVVAGYPNYLLYLSLEANYKDLSLIFEERVIGKQYIDPKNEFTIEPYFVSNVIVNYNFKNILLKFGAYNVFNNLYNQFGYVGDNGEPLFIPASERNYFIGFGLSF
ncbi:MAG: TonB-dependent receptor [candidate division WOR-3 bacterium]